MSQRDQIDRLAELMKLLRSEALSKTAIKAETGWHDMTVRKWVMGLTAHGILDFRAISSTRRVYFLSHAWGGSA